MPLLQTRPGEGPERRRTHWVYVPTPKGKTWDAWSAGPVHWFACHVKGKTKPCTHILTNGAVPCQRCTPFDPVEVKGFVPLYREMDGRPCFVIVSEFCANEVEQLKRHRLYRLGRGEGATDAVWFRECVGKPKYTSSIPERLLDADLTESLLRIWNITELVAWYNKHHRGNDNAVSLKPKPAPTMPATTPPPMIEADKKGPLDRLREAEEKRLREEAEEKAHIGSTMATLLGGVAKKNGVFKKS